MSVENYELISKLAADDVEVLKQKGLQYGRSWIKRGGVGAFMMLARKWDRIENTCEQLGYDIIAGCEIDSESLLDDIADLRRYLLLVEAEYLGQKRQTQEITALAEQRGISISQKEMATLYKATLYKAPLEHCPYCRVENQQHDPACPTKR